MKARVMISQKISVFTLNVTRMKLVSILTMSV